MKTLRLLAGVLMISLAFSCSTTKVTSDYKSHVDFQALRTYKIVYELNEQEVQTNVNSLDRDRIEHAVKNELKYRGMTQDENPDVYLVYHLGLEKTNNYSTTGSGYASAYGRRGYRSGFGHGQSTTTVYTTTHGTLSIEMYDAVNDDLLWYGRGSKEISSNQKKREQRINDNVTRVMDSYPVAKTDTMAEGS